MYRNAFMVIAAPHSDNDLLDLLRIAGPLGVEDLSDAMEVTPTAVRQRLMRLLAHGMIQRDAIRNGRGRPKHRYWLTDKGVRVTGSNFNDLAVTLWHEVRAVNDPALQKEMLARIARALAATYADQVHGVTVAERMRSLSDLLARRRIPVSVEEGMQKPVLRAHACPYPSLAEEDRGICTMEKMMFSALLGDEVELTRCRLDGSSDCQFQAK